MSIPEFDSAEYIQPAAAPVPAAFDPNPAYAAIEPQSPVSDRYPLALLYGALAAAAGALVYALIAQSGFMVSIVAIGMAWLIARAMMTASRGIGGRKFQIAAVIFTYIAVAWGEVLAVFIRSHLAKVFIFALINPMLWGKAMTLPVLEVREGFNGIIGAVILFIGMRAAWRMAAGGPGFAAPARRNGLPSLFR